jgi:hypothetical protein
MERKRGTGRHVWQVLVGFGLEKAGAFLNALNLEDKNMRNPEALTPIYAIRANETRSWLVGFPQLVGEKERRMKMARCACACSCQNP